jgi:hypothetical protein
MEEKKVLKKVMKHDGSYERRNPHRHYWLRRSFPGEYGERMLRGTLPSNMRVFTVVHRTMPGIRCRVFVALPADYDTDCCEAFAKDLFNRFLSTSDD